MCGIITHLSFNPASRVSAEFVSQLNDMLIHRGPDDAGIHLSGNVAMGMRRLSIVDLGGGRQPLTCTQGRYTIVFNGEIYGHHTLRARLEKAGHVFQTQSDTEVVLNAFIAWGKDCLQYINGMFAFTIWDETDKTLFVARDRLGIKPLYYIQDSKRILFSSELTPIIRSGLFDLQLDPMAISEYLSYWYICEPNTIFKNVRQLSPGHYAVVANGSMHIEPYWQIPRQPEEEMTFQEAKDRLMELLCDSVRTHMAADVPVGTFLSGGIDSGIVTALASKTAHRQLEAFAIGFIDSSYDETRLARQTAARHQVSLNVHIMEHVSGGLMEEIINAFDEPLGNASYVPTYLLARAARSKLKVVLTGDGGDELFGGYPTYQAPYYQAIWDELPRPIKNIIRGEVAKMPVAHSRISLDYRLKQLMQGIDLDYQRAHYTWRQIASDAQQQALWRGELRRSLGRHDPFDVAKHYFDKASGLESFNQLMFVDLNTFLLNDHLRKVDRMTMAHGLEARVPFLDHRIVELAMRMPSRHKVDLFTLKKVLKRAAAPYLPPAVLKGGKKGLTSPIAGWIDGPLRDYAGDVLSGGIVGEFFEPHRVAELLEDHLAKKKDNSRLLWALMTLQVWHRQKVRRG